MRKILAMLLLASFFAMFLSGCDDDNGGKYKVPTKTGGGGREQPYIPAGNKAGGQYVHLDKN